LYANSIGHRELDLLEFARLNGNGPLSWRACPTTRSRVFTAGAAMTMSWVVGPKSVYIYLI